MSQPRTPPPAEIEGPFLISEASVDLLSRFLFRATPTA